VKKTWKLIFLLFLYSVLSACNNNSIPKTVTIENVAYRSGFYGDLYPKNFIYTDDYYKVGINKFRRVNCDRFDLIEFANDGSVYDILYCAESQWKQAYTYYENRDNFVYYCMIGEPNIYIEPVIITIPNMDHEKFDALMVFANQNIYNPFGSNKNKKIRRLPLPDREESPRLVFYRESNDGFFNSYRGNMFHVINDKLLLVFYYDYGHGEYMELVAVDVPDDLGQYFIKCFKEKR
jgi:hypothetical protein